MGSARQLRLRQEEAAAAQNNINDSGEEAAAAVPLRQIYDQLLSSALVANGPPASSVGLRLPPGAVEGRVSQAELRQREQQLERLEREFAERHPGDWSFLTDVWALGAAYLLCKVFR